MTTIVINSPKDQAFDLSFGSVPGWVPYVFAAVCFMAIVLIIVALAWPRSRQRERIDQISHFGPGRTVPGQQPEPEQGGVITRTALRASANLVRAGGAEARIAARLERAGINLRPHEWILIRIGAVLLGAVLFFLLAGWLGALVGALVGFLATMLYQNFKVSRRVDAFSEQLPDGLQLVVGSLRSGFSLPQAVDALVRESPEPLNSEFGRALGEYRLGGDLADALQRVATRTKNQDLGWALMAIRIQREVGGNLAEVLQTAVETMRERARLRRHVSSLAAEGRLSGYILVALPLILGVFMFITRREYMAPLFTDPLGIILLLVGTVLLILGILWMIRVVKVEV
jgi:Flp pilus assembly protein TadB